jgi:hypothetical protein
VLRCVVGVLALWVVAMSVRQSAWRSTGKHCDVCGHVVEECTVRTEILQPPGYWEEKERRVAWLTAS